MNDYDKDNVIVYDFEGDKCIRKVMTKEEYNAELELQKRS